MIEIDRGWLAANPLPDHADGSDKNDRGRMLLVGGSGLVPGALRLTAEAAFRAGAGKVRIATIAAAAMALGVLVPEGGMIALPGEDDGEIAEGAAAVLVPHLDRTDCLLVGPGMSDAKRATALVEGLLAEPRETMSVLLDAAAIACARELEAVLARHRGRAVLTPHHGEMAALTGHDVAAIARDPARIACETAARFHAVVVLKAGETIVAAPEAAPLHYAGGGVGLASGGSGDVLAGVIGGLLARGATPTVAAAWGVWLHGEAGRRLSAQRGLIGLLARELPAEIPALMAEAARDAAG